MIRHRLVLLVLISLFYGYSSLRYSSRNSNEELHISTVKNNVCKSLYQKAVVYAIFVDSRNTNAWTEFDMTSTLDSIKLAMIWIEQEAEKAAIPLKIQLDFHRDENKIIPIDMNLTRKTFSATLLGSGGVRNIDRWADKIGYEALKIFGPDTSKTTRTKIKPKDRERLIARLRDLHKTDNVALIYFINNYFTDEISAAIHTATDDSPEYAVVSFKQPSVIAHEFLHLFGALDLYVSPFDSDRAARKRKSFAMKEFPNEIMAFSYRRLDSLSISPLTQYLIGWKRQLDPEYEKMLVKGKIRIAKY